MGFFKNLFGNKSEDEASATSKPTPQETGDSTVRPAEPKPNPPAREPETHMQSEKSKAASKASPKISTPTIEQQQSAKVKETNQYSANTVPRREVPAKSAPQRAEGPPPIDNVVQFKSVSVSSAPPTAKHRRVTPPAPPKVPPKDDAKRLSNSGSSRDSEPKVPRPMGPTQSSDK